MENNKKRVGSSSSSTNFDHLFGPRNSTSSSSSIFGSIFTPPSTVVGEDSENHETGHRGGRRNVGSPGRLRNKVENGSSGVNSKEVNIIHQSTNQCYFSSSIYYGGQENYSPKTIPSSSASQNIFKKDSNDEDLNGSNSNSAPRGNWWQGSLYY